LTAVSVALRGGFGPDACGLRIDLVGGKNPISIKQSRSLLLWATGERSATSMNICLVKLGAQQKWRLGGCQTHISIYTKYCVDKLFH
jgi:hypothetical protein